MRPDPSQMGYYSSAERVSSLNESDIYWVDDMSQSEFQSIRAAGPTIWDPTFDQLSKEFALRDMQRTAIKRDRFRTEEKRAAEQQAKRQSALRERQQCLDRMSPSGLITRTSAEQGHDSRFGMFDYVEMARREEARMEMAQEKMRRDASIKARDGREIRASNHSEWQVENLLDPQKAQRFQDNDALLRRLFPEEGF
jgi:hypothetical protein